MTLLQIYKWVCQWKNYQNRLTFGKVMGKSLVSCFFLRHSVNEAEDDDGVLGCSGMSWTTCKQSAPRSRQTTTPTPNHSIFTGWMLFLMPNQQRWSTERYYQSNTNLSELLWRRQKWKDETRALYSSCRAESRILCRIWAQSPCSFVSHQFHQ